MKLYALTLFIHVSAVLLLFAALSVELLSLYRLRRAATLTYPFAWIEPVPRLPLIVASSGLVTMFSEVYLDMRMSAFGLSVTQGGRCSALTSDGTARSCYWQTHASDPPSFLGL